MDKAEEKSQERRRLLRRKLQGNLQRNTRRDYLADLPDDLSSYLGRHGFLSIEEFADVRPRFRITSEGFGTPPTKPGSYSFREFAWHHKVLGEAGKLDARHDARPAFFWPGDDNPIYQVEFGWVRKNLSRLLYYHLAVIAVDDSAGLIVDDYCGYVENDPNADEVVYQLAVWEFGAVTN